MVDDDVSPATDISDRIPTFQSGELLEGVSLSPNTVLAQSSTFLTISNQVENSTSGDGPKPVEDGATSNELLHLNFDSFRLPVLSNNFTANTVVSSTQSDEPIGSGGIPPPTITCTTPHGLTYPAVGEEQTHRRLTTHHIVEEDGHVEVIATSRFAISLSSSRSLVHSDVGDTFAEAELDTFDSILNMSMNLDFETPMLAHFSLLERPARSPADIDEDEVDVANSEPSFSSSLADEYAAELADSSSPLSAMDGEEAVHENERKPRRRAIQAASEITHSRASLPSSSMYSDGEAEAKSFTSRQITRNRQEALKKLSSDLPPVLQVEEESDYSDLLRATTVVEQIRFDARLREELEANTARPPQVLSGKSGLDVDNTGVSSLTEGNLALHNKSGDSHVNNHNQNNNEAQVNQVAHIVSPFEISLPPGHSSPFSERNEEEFHRLIEGMTPVASLKVKKVKSRNSPTLQDETTKLVSPTKVPRQKVISGQQGFSQSERRTTRNVTPFPLPSEDQSLVPAPLNIRKLSKPLPPLPADPSTPEKTTSAMKCPKGSDDESYASDSDAGSPHPVELPHQAPKTSKLPENVVSRKPLLSRKGGKAVDSIAPSSSELTNQVTVPSHLKLQSPASVLSPGETTMIYPLPEDRTTQTPSSPSPKDRNLGSPITAHDSPHATLAKRRTKLFDEVSNIAAGEEGPSNRQVMKNLKECIEALGPEEFEEAQQLLDAAKKENESGSKGGFARNSLFQKLKSMRPRFQRKKGPLVAVSEPGESNSSSTALLSAIPEHQPITIDELPSNSLPSVLVGPHESEENPFQLSQESLLENYRPARRIEETQRADIVHRTARIFKTNSESDSNLHGNSPAGIDTYSEVDEESHGDAPPAINADSQVVDSFRENSPPAINIASQVAGRLHFNAPPAIMTDPGVDCGSRDPPPAAHKQPSMPVENPKFERSRSFFKVGKAQNGPKVDRTSLNALPRTKNKRVMPGIRNIFKSGRAQQSTETGDSSQCNPLSSTDLSDDPFFPVEAQPAMTGNPSDSSSNDGTQKENEANNESPGNSSSLPPSPLEIQPSVSSRNSKYEKNKSFFKTGRTQKEIKADDNFWDNIVPGGKGKATLMKKISKAAPSLFKADTKALEQIGEEDEDLYDEDATEIPDELVNEPLGQGEEEEEGKGKGKEKKEDESPIHMPRILWPDRDDSLRRA